MDDPTQCDSVQLSQEHYVEIKPIQASLEELAPTQAWTQEHGLSAPQPPAPLPLDSDLQLFNNSVHINRSQSQNLSQGQSQSQGGSQSQGQDASQLVPPIPIPISVAKDAEVVDVDGHDPSPLSPEVVPETPTRYESSQHIPETQMDMDGMDIDQAVEVVPLSDRENEYADRDMDVQEQSQELSPRICFSAGRSQSLPLETQLVAYSQLVDSTPVRFNPAKHSQSVAVVASQSGDIDSQYYAYTNNTHAHTNTNTNNYNNYAETQQVGFNHLLKHDPTSQAQTQQVAYHYLLRDDQTPKQQGKNGNGNGNVNEIENEIVSSTPGSCVPRRKSAGELSASIKLVTVTPQNPRPPPSFPLRANFAEVPESQDKRGSLELSRLSDLSSVEETPYKKRKVADTCVWTVYGTEWWAGYIEEGIYWDNEDDYGAKQFKVTFGDGSYLERQISQIRRFDLTSGDVVKTTQDKRSNYKVVRLVASNNKFVGTSQTQASVAGTYSSVELEHMKNKSSPTTTVPLLSLYMLPSQIKTYLKSSGRSPVNTVSNIDRSLAGTRSGLKKVTAHLYSTGSNGTNKANAAALNQNSISKRVEPASALTAYGGDKQSGSSGVILPTQSGIFDNCVFVTSGLEEDVGQKLRHLVCDHGGMFLVNGFSDLFEADLSKLSLSWRTKDERFSNLTFAAVLSRKPQRTTKYLEALALQWPCLSWRFVDQAIRQNSLDNWDKFVLAAGISSYLDEAYCSLDISAFKSNWQLQKTLQYQFEARTSPLESVEPLLLDSSQLIMSSSSSSTSSSTTDSDNTRHLQLQLPTEVHRMLHLLLLACSPKNAPIRSIGKSLGDRDLVIDFRPNSQAVRNKEWLIQTIINGRVGE